MVSLIEQYKGDWPRVCEHYAEQLLNKNKLKPHHRKEFIAWMLPKGSYYSRIALCADPRVYAQAFYVHRKLHDDSQEQQHLMIVGGKVGKGKTTFASQFCSLVDPTYCLERVCYLPHQFFKVVTKLKPGQAVHIDEGGNFFKALNTSTKSSKYLGQYFQMARSKRLLIVINYDDYEKMNKEIREKCDTIVYKIPNPSEPAPTKFRHYWWYKGVAVQAINNIFNSKRKLPLTHKEMLRYISFKGYNHKDYPRVNDLDEATFKEHKMKYVKVFEDLMLREFDDLVTASEKEQAQEELEEKFLAPRKVREKFGISDSYLKKLRAERPEIVVKFGTMFRYNEKKIYEIMKIGENT